MDKNAQVALYVAMTAGIIASGLWFYGAGFKHGVWAVTFGVIVFVLLFGAAYWWLVIDPGSTP